MFSGRIDFYKQAGGYGFIHYVAPDNSLTKFFFHVSSVIAGEPRTDARVQFTPVAGKKGPAAVDVKVLAEGK